MVQKKKNIKLKQKQKQQQNQKVIVNVMTSKSRNSTRKTKATAVRQPPVKPSPLIQSLPIQYTPYTMYDTSRLITEDAFNPRRGQIFNPQIPNAINVEPMIQEAIPIPNVVEPIMQAPAAVEVATTTQPNSEYDDVFIADELNDHTLEPEMPEAVFDRKTQEAINASYPTPYQLWDMAQNSNSSSFQLPVDNSIDRLITVRSSNGSSNSSDNNDFYNILSPNNAEEEDYIGDVYKDKGEDNIDDFYKIISPTGEGQIENPLNKKIPKNDDNSKFKVEKIFDKKQVSHRKTETTKIDDEEEINLNIGKSNNFYITGENRYFCYACGYDVTNSKASIKSHKKSQTHKRNMLEKRMEEDGDY